ALRSQQRAAQAAARGFFAAELVPVEIAQRKGKPPLRVERDEHPRPETTLEQLAALPTPFRANGTVTAGNASGVNDGACALLVASAGAVKRWNLTPRARVIATATAGVEPRIMGMGPVGATRKVLTLARLTIGQLEVIELNEAFASQALAVLRELGLPDDADHVNPNGGAIALGHPLGMSGARLATTAVSQLQASGARYALCTMCIGVGQGIAVVLERV
ncbi:MAG: acetyl-CoA C-acyltransferase, partial [Gammaproteobacteria bacterium]|nr:acetyl-CoA C-acyltransferase [Gammaproteobacteria bacterium]